MSIVPKISLIMSVYNGEDYLAETIESVLSQPFTEWEFIIINDCSTDNTSKILAEYASKDARVETLLSIDGAKVVGFDIDVRDDDILIEKEDIK